MRHLDNLCETSLKVVQLVQALHAGIASGYWTNADAKWISHSGGIRWQGERLNPKLAWVDDGHFFTPVKSYPRKTDSVIYDPGNNAYGHVYATLCLAAPPNTTIHFKDEKAGDYFEIILALARLRRLGKKFGNSWLDGLNVNWEEVATMVEGLIRAYQRIEECVPILNRKSTGKSEDSRRW
eukprot:10593264-Karenia_brevis.AAC.1